MYDPSNERVTWSEVRPDSINLDMNKQLEEVNTRFLANGSMVDFIQMMIILNLEPWLIEMLKRIYLARSHVVSRKRDKYRRFSTVISIVVMAGSILTTTLLSLQGIPDVNQSSYAGAIWWTTWSLSVAVALFTTLNKVFSVDKNYYNHTSTYNSLKDEGCEYLALSGKYEKFRKMEGPYYNAYPTFMNKINSIIRKANLTEISTAKEGSKALEDISSSVKPHQYTSSNRFSTMLNVVPVERVDTQIPNTPLANTREEVSTPVLHVEPASILPEAPREVELSTPNRDQNVDVEGATEK